LENSKQSYIWIIQADKNCALVKEHSKLANILQDERMNDQAKFLFELVISKEEFSLL